MTGLHTQNNLHYLNNIQVSTARDLMIMNTIIQGVLPRKFLILLPQESLFRKVPIEE